MRQEKIQLEQTLEQEQEYQVNKLMRKIDKLESDVTSKQTTLEQVTDKPWKEGKSHRECLVVVIRG